MPASAVAFLKRLPLHGYAVAARWHSLAGRLIPWFAVAAVLLAGAGLAIGLFAAPAGLARSEVDRIAFVHLPAVWLSVFLYLVMAFYAVLVLALDSRLPATLMASLAPTGAVFCVIALATGSLWSRPTGGAWWVWDARLTAELILLLLYLGFLALRSAIADARRADHACAVLVLVGLVNLPIVYYSVHWWNSLHHGAVVGLASSPAMARTMLLGTGVMALAFWMYSLAVVLARVRCLMLEREADRRRTD
jgi:heme exporter protein C